MDEISEASKLDSKTKQEFVFYDKKNNKYI